MTEHEEKMMYAAFALTGLLSNPQINMSHAASVAWKMAEQMMVYKPRENDDE